MCDHPANQRLVGPSWKTSVEALLVHRKSTAIVICALTLVAAISGVNRAFGQECPRAGSTGPFIASRVRTLEGRLVYHDGIRQWFELKFDAPQCGHNSVQLTDSEEDSKTLEILRGCRVKSTGAIEYSLTGYYSLDIFQDVKEVQSAGPCSRQAPFPDYSGAKPDKLIHRYSVEMHVNYRPGDHPVAFRVWSAGRELHPWQAYASYWLTGGFVLYGRCGEGFVVDKVFGTPEANPMHFDDPRTRDDMATFDPESAAPAGKWDLHLRYTCIREPAEAHRKP